MSLHVKIARERLATDGTDDAARVQTPVICAFARSLNLFAALATFVHVTVDVQSTMLVKFGTADEPATANFALERSVAGVRAAMCRQQIGARERPVAIVARERLRDRNAGVKSGEMGPHTALQGEGLRAGRARYPTSGLGDRLVHIITGILLD